MRFIYICLYVFTPPGSTLIIKLTLLYYQRLSETLGLIKVAVHSVSAEALL